MKRLLNKPTIITAIICLLIGRFALAPKPKVITKEVVKIVEVEKKQTKKKKTVTEVKNPDGSSTTQTTETEDTTSETSTSISSSKATESKRGVTLGALAIKDTKSYSPIEYGATVSAPVFGSISVQGLVTSSKLIGIGLSIEF